jgi:tripartite-type tricarboxylate transporter receptor subunit TctC
MKHVLLLAALIAPTALAQSYPAKPVRVMLGFAPGSLQDITVRLVGDKMTTSLGQPVVIENRPGAAGRIAVEATARSAPDGYTVVFGTAATHVLAVYLVKNLSYDPVNDFTPISLAIAPVVGVVVNAAVPVSSIPELVTYAKAHPGKLAYASTGVGSSFHLMGERIKLAAGIDMLHIPLTGGNDTLKSLVGGHVQVGFMSPGQAQIQVNAGKLKMLAVGVGKRFAAFPDLPTIADVLPGYDAVSDWFGYFGPAGLPAPVLARLNAEVVKGLNAPDVRARLDQTTIVVGSTPQELAETVKRDIQVFAKIVKAVGIPPQ